MLGKFLSGLFLRHFDRNLANFIRIYIRLRHFQKISRNLSAPASGIWLYFQGSYPRTTMLTSRLTCRGQMVGTLFPNQHGPCPDNEKPVYVELQPFSSQARRQNLSELANCLLGHYPTLPMFSISWSDTRGLILDLGSIFIFSTALY